MAILRLLTCICLVLQVVRISGFGTGAPVAACAAQMPGHVNISPQTTANPYTISLDGATTYKYGTAITVKIEGEPDFKGIFIQALKKGTGVPVGTFVEPAAGAGVKWRPCPDDSSPNNGITHTSVDELSPDTLELTWNPPNEDVGGVEFKATIAQEKAVYWLGAVSPTITADPEAELEPTTPEPKPEGTTAGGTVAKLSIWSLVAVFLASIGLLVKGRVY